MEIKTVSVRALGKNYKCSEHISLGELQCKDGTDTVKYCDETLKKAEQLRSLTGSTAIIITSGYRTPAYNKKIGGASKSTHTQGYALDIAFNNSKYNIKQICCMAQDLGVKGIGYISSTALHIDMSNRIYRGDERRGYSNNVGNDFYTYFGIAKGSLPTSQATPSSSTVDTSKLPTIRRRNSAKYVQYVRQMQQKLKEKGFKGSNGKDLTIDGKWGDNTDYALYNFQKSNKLVADKICGKKTWNCLYK